MGRCANVSKLGRKITNMANVQHNTWVCAVSVRGTGRHWGKSRESSGGWNCPSACWSWPVEPLSSFWWQYTEEAGWWVGDEWVGGPWDAEGFFLFHQAWWGREARGSAAPTTRWCCWSGPSWWCHCKKWGDGGSVATQRTHKTVLPVGAVVLTVQERSSLRCAPMELMPAHPR